MLRFLRIAALVAGCMYLPQVAAIAEESAAEESALQPQEAITKPPDGEPADKQATDGQAASSDSVSRGYYANYPAKGYYAPYVYWPNYPPKYPALLGYGFGYRGQMLYRPRYIHGHPDGYLRGHCPNDRKYGPVYYQSGMPVSGPVVGWLHY